MLVCKFVFTLSHDQNQIERVYNVNKDMFCVNMERILLKTGKMVYDHIISLEAPVISFVIKKELTQSCKDSLSKYVETIECTFN